MRSSCCLCVCLCIPLSLLGIGAPRQAGYMARLNTIFFVSDVSYDVKRATRLLFEPLHFDPKIYALFLRNFKLSPKYTLQKTVLLI
jgi:hypothetical protein